MGGNDASELEHEEFPGEEDDEDKVGV